MNTEAQLKELRALTIAEKSRRTYDGYSAQFLLWVLEHDPEILSSEFKIFVQNLQKVTPTTAKMFFKSGPKPIYFNRLTAKHFLSYIVRLKGQKNLSYNVYAMHRASLMNLYRDYHESMCLEMKEEIKNHFIGLKRVSAKQIQQGNGQIRTGKERLKMELFKYLCKNMQANPNSEHIFAQSFMIFAWNLVCRAGNVASMCFDHLEWNSDCLGVYFAHSKTDQFGERPREAKHIYANPIHPYICPILSLGVYLLCFPPLKSQKALFPGGSQEERFRQIFSRFLQSPNINEELKRYGIKHSDLGTHSFRKGAATYLSAGSTNGPSAVAIQLRAGWSLPGVQDTYLRFENASDMFVGRTVSGLPINTPEFAILPPFFETFSEKVKEAVVLCFPTVSERFFQVAEFALASLIYHSEWIRKNFNQKHPIFQTSLFTSKIIPDLRNFVNCRIATAADIIQPTGIPSHVIILKEIQEMNKKVEKLELMGPHVIESVMNQIDDRACSLNQISPMQIETLFQKTPLFQAVEDLRGFLKVNDASKINEQQLQKSLNEGSANIYTWGGSFHQVPEFFSLNQCTFCAIWRNWWLGDIAKNYPPFWKLQPRDMPTSNSKKRLCDLRFLMKKIEQHLGPDVVRILRNHPTEEVVSQEFLRAETFPISNQTEKNRERRLGQISWRTLANNLRIKVRKA